MKRRALMSVTDKTGIVKFARKLVGMDWEIISTGGTAKALTDAGIPCTLVEDVTHFPEMLNGRLKTLHPKIFGGILAERSKPAHMQTIAEHDIGPIDMVVVNLYNFAGHRSVEQIDIGGPSLLRAAAKNHIDVIVVVDPDDYAEVAYYLETGGLTRMDKQRLAQKVFRATANYDMYIADYFRDCCQSGKEVELGTH